MKTDICAENPFGRDRYGFLYEVLRKQPSKPQHLDYGTFDGAVLVALSKAGVIERPNSLDELPSFLNVLAAKLSLAGPRPLMTKYLSLYNEEHRRRLEVMPGITRWPQISGRNAIAWEEKFKLDVWYVDHLTLWLDVKILVATIGKLFSSQDINQPDHPPMTEFKGSENG